MVSPENPAKSMDTFGCSKQEIADILSKLAVDELKRGTKRAAGEAIGRATGTKPQKDGLVIADQPDWMGLTCCVRLRAWQDSNLRPAA